jgi:hypothetical protein
MELKFPVDSDRVRFEANRDCQFDPDTGVVVFE